MKKSHLFRTKISLLLSVLALLASLHLPSTAYSQDVPPYLTHQGRLMDALNAPINGAQELIFNLYVEETGGTAFWTEVQTVLLTEGFSFEAIASSPFLFMTIECSQSVHSIV